MRKQWKGFLTGMLVTAMALGMVNSTVAALVGRTIEVYTGVNVYVDDQLVEPKDANGNPVEVFVYNGTTYLPIRAIGNALGLPVEWEGKTQSAYVGKHKGDKPNVWVKDLNYFTRKGTGFSVLDNDTDNLGNPHQESLTLNNYYYKDQSTSCTYKINGQYSAISGTLYHRYAYRDENRTSTLKIYGDGECIYTISVNNEIEPIDFYVSLSGVLELKIVLSGDCLNDGIAAIADFGLWT